MIRGSILTRFTVAILIAACLGFSAGSAVILLPPSASVDKARAFADFSDKVSARLRTLGSSNIAGPVNEYYESISTGIHAKVVAVPRTATPGAGGALAIVENDVLAMTFTGKLYLVSEDGSYTESGIVLPDNGLSAFRKTALKPQYANFRHRFGRLRYNELEYLEGPEGGSLFITYTEFHADEDCFTLSAMRLPLPKGPLMDMEIDANVWERVFQSDPCLPLRGVNASIQGEEAGGGIAFSNDGSKVFISVGEYGWNGWDSDGLTEMSKLQLAQLPQFDQGKIVEIDLSTLESRHITSGHRNAQGLSMDSDGLLWSVEHGPRGGDELNLIEEGNNYGWPIVTYGTDYNGSPIPGVMTSGFHEGYEKPVWSWLPSVGISRLTTQKTPFHSTWDGDLLAISLNGQALFRIRVDDRRAVFVEKIAGFNRRLRDIEQDHDGRLVIWTDSHEVLFLVPISGGFGEQLVSRYIQELENSDASLGAQLSEVVYQCSVCHSFNSHQHSSAPSLAQVYGARIGSVKIFDGYSQALLNAKGSWTDDHLSAFLRNPDLIVPGTSMPNPEIKDEKVIEQLVLLLRALSEDDL